MVEGCSQGMLGANWGDGFNTDPMSVAALKRATPGSDPNPFFRQLLRAPYRCSGPVPCFHCALTAIMRCKSRQSRKIPPVP